jgi:hypothetical protein
MVAAHFLVRRARQCGRMRTINVSPPEQQEEAVRVWSKCATGEKVRSYEISQEERFETIQGDVEDRR